MINSGIDGLRFEPGESHSELGYAVDRLGIFVNPRDDDLRIQPCIAQRPEPGLGCRRENEPDRRSHQRQIRARAARSGSSPIGPRFKASEWNLLKSKLAPLRRRASSRASSQIRSPTL